MWVDYWGAKGYVGPPLSNYWGGPAPPPPPTPGPPSSYAYECRGVLLVWIMIAQRIIALAVGAGGDCMDLFSLVYHLPLLAPSLWETARYRLKYCLKGPLNQKKPTNQPTNLDYDCARAYCACSRCGWRLYAQIFFCLSFPASCSVSLGDGPI